MENLYKQNTFNLFNHWRNKIIGNSYLDWDETADNLKSVKSHILRMNIQENDKDWDESQDLLNQIEMDIDYCYDQF